MYYTKEVTSGGKVKYVPVDVKEFTIELSNQQVMSLAATIAVCCLIGLEENTPDHSLRSRLIKEIESSITNLTKLHGSQLDDAMVQVGIGAWGAAMEYLADHVNVND